MKYRSDIQITNEDNMDLMARYPDNYFDLAIVDPPYGIDVANDDRFGKQSSKKSAAKTKSYKKKDWDLGVPKKDYPNNLFRVSKNQIVWGVNYFNDYRLCGGRIFWEKGVPDGYTKSRGEIAYKSKGVGVDFVSIMWHGMLQHDMKNKEIRIHPTQKPVKLYEWLLMNYATCKTCKNEGGYYEDVAGDGGSKMWIDCDDCICSDRNTRILDTHLGSGSIAVACDNLGFDLVACELDRDYYESALKRLKNHRNQLQLF